MTKKIKVVEVGPRDGLQNEPNPLTVGERLEFIKKLSLAGISYIEAGAFVSPKWVPQMAGSSKVLKRILAAQKKQKLFKNITYSALVPNSRGMDDALAVGLKEVAIFGAASETFSKKNINCSVADSMVRFQDVLKMAQKNKVKVRAYLSTAFGCPYEGEVSEKKVVEIVRSLHKMGAYEISIGDTIGVATPRQVKRLVEKLKVAIPVKKLAMHFHDTRGTALANVYASIEMGISTFDSSTGGLGGCPYARGASGNLGTEDLVYMLDGMGLATGIDLAKLIRIKMWIEHKLGRPLPSHVGKAGLPLPGTLR